MKSKSRFFRLLAVSLCATMLMVTTSCATDTEVATQSTETAEASAATANTDDAVSSDGVSAGITVWAALSQEELNMYAEIYNSINPNVSVESVAVPYDNYLTKLQTSFRAGTGAPDVALLEIAHFGSFKDTEFLENLSVEPYNMSAEEANIIPYVAEISKDSQGDFKGMSYQATPGGFWYNKKLALEYLGTDDPDEIAAMVETWDVAIETGEKVYEQSGGEAYLFDTFVSITTPMLYNDGAPKVDEAGKIMDLTPIFETAKAVRDNNGEAMLEMESPAWAAAIYENQNFILMGSPSWGLHYRIKANTPSDATDTDNSWGFVPAPQDYQAGGTWLAIYSGSENKEAAFDYLKTVTTNVDYLKEYVNRTGDFVGYVPAIESIIADGFRDPFTGDQPIYEYMYNVAMEINAPTVTNYDASVNAAIEDKLALVLAGEMSVEDGVAATYSDIQTQFPELTF